ncbi:hypothetical protein ABC733_14615 [Mangrovibacter sp. SLW1]
MINKPFHPNRPSLDYLSTLSKAVKFNCCLPRCAEGNRCLMSFDLLPMVYAELISEEKIAESLADTEFKAQKSRFMRLDWCEGRTQITI